MGLFIKLFLAVKNQYKSITLLQGILNQCSYMSTKDQAEINQLNIQHKGE